MSPKTCKCVPCDFCDGKGYWQLHDKDRKRDCYGCDRSGIIERCEEHKEKDDDE
jgi:hypothetical protein